MNTKDLLSIALANKLPHEAIILNECASIADFLVRMQTSVSNSVEAIRMAKDFIHPDLSHVARVITSVGSRDDFHTLYVGPNIESASKALQDFEFDEKSFDAWQEVQCIRIIDTWCYGSLMTSTSY